MAYPAGLGPYGFAPYNLEGGRVYAGATRKLPIASGYASNIGYGDLVILQADGTIARLDTSTGAKAAFANPPIGVFLGCSYSQDSGLKYSLWSQSWTGGTTASDAYAVIADDPNVLFKVLVTNGSGVAYTSGGATAADVGANLGYYQAGGTSGTALINTATGDSVVSANLASKATTATLPFRIVDVVTLTALSDGTFQEVVVQYTPPSMAVTQATTSPYTVSAVTVTGGHFYRNPTGV
jgi:hypothetical protein